MAGALRRAAGWSLVGALSFLPLLVLLPRSFSGAAGGRFSLEHYRALLEPRVLGLLGTSLLLSLGAVLVAGFLGAGAALLLETRRVPGRPLLRLLALAPLLLPHYMLVLAWRPLLLAVLPGGQWGRCAAAALVLGLGHAPLVFFFASHGIRSIPGEILEASRLLLPPGKAALRVVLPLAAPSIVAGAALAFVLSFLEQETPALFLVQTHATEVFLQVSKGPGAAFAAAAPAALCLLFLTWGAERWASRRGFALAGAGSPEPPRSQPRPGPAAALGLCACAVVLLGVPLARLAALGASPAVLDQALRLHGEAVAAAIPLAGGAAALATALAALCQARGGKPRALESLVAWLPLAVPGTVLAAGFTEVYNRPVLEVLYSSPAILALAGAARFFPIAYHALGARLRTVPRDLRDAAALVRLPAWRRLLRLELPLAAPGLALALTAVALLQAGEVGAAVLLAPPGHRPLSVVISSELHYNVDLEVPAALCLIQAASVLLLVGALALLSRVAARRR